MVLKSSIYVGHILTSSSLKEEKQIVVYYSLRITFPSRECSLENHSLLFDFVCFFVNNADRTELNRFIRTHVLNNRCIK